MYAICHLPVFVSVVRCVTSRISSRLVKALTQDYVCLLTTPTEVNWYSFALEEKCIFVPKKVAESTQCGGLRLFENVSHITNDPDFCNKKMGKTHTLWLAILPSFLPPSLPSSITKQKNSVHSFSIATHVPAGDCIGESFSSPDRFPVIPPFGAPELSGIYLITLLFLYIHKIIGSVSTGLSYKLSRSTNYYIYNVHVYTLFFC